MDASDPIDAYLRELNRQLRVPRRARRRILAEVRAHLLDAAEAERSPSAQRNAAAERAVIRFGLVAETAGQFNRLADRRRGVVLRRTLVPWIAAVALTSLATATVWASGPSPPQARQRPHHFAQRSRCAGRPVTPSSEPALHASLQPPARPVEARAACRPLHSDGR